MEKRKPARINPSRPKKPDIVDIARKLVREHRKQDPLMKQAFLVKDPAGKEIRIVEVTAEVVDDDFVMPVAFRPDKDVPYPSVFVFFHPDEFQRFRKGQIELPEGWGSPPVLTELPL